MKADNLNRRIVAFKIRSGYIENTDPLMKSEMVFCTLLQILWINIKPKK